MRGGLAKLAFRQFKYLSNFESGARELCMFPRDIGIGPMLRLEKQGTSEEHRGDDSHVRKMVFGGGETMNEIKQNENEPPEHFELRYLMQEAKAIVLPMDSDQRKKWVAESRMAQEIYAILVQHPQYYEEFRGFVGQLFPEPIS